MKFLTIKELSELLSVKEPTLYSWASKGLIPSLKLNGLLRFDLDEISEWIEKHKKGAEYVPEMSFKAKNCDSLDPRDVARNAIDEVLGLGYNSPQRGNQIDKPGKEGS
jgi:excisionase family DNA binding protein